MTLPELLIAAVLTASISVALGHVVRQFSVTVSSIEGRARTQTEASLAMLRMRSDIQLAIQILSVSSDAISVVHPDVTGDGVADSVSYTWDGPGAALMRQINANEPEPVLERCNSLTIDTIRAGSPGEELLAAHSRYGPGLPSEQQQFLISGPNMAAEVFTANRAEAASFRVTRARVHLQPSPGPGMISLNLRHVSAGSPGSSIETVSRSFSQMSPGSGWEEFTLRAQTDLTPGTPYALVLRCDGTSSAKVTYDHILEGAPASSSDFFRYTNNGGSSWLPSSDLGERDIRYYVYGRFLDASGQPMPSVRLPVKAVGIHLEAGPPSSPVRLETAISCINTPEVSG